MPGAPHAPPPPFFEEVCARWADGRATAYDAAVLTSLTTDTPLPEPHDPEPVGFLSTTRQPPTSTVHLFHEAKNAARAQHHATVTAAAAAALSASLTTDAPPPALFSHPPPTPTLSAAPARLGALQAAKYALGACRTVRWTVPRAALAAAGPSFVQFFRALGWHPQPTVDPEIGLGEESVCFVSSQTLTDRAILRGAIELSRGPRAYTNVVPAGSVTLDAPREQSARAGAIARVVLRIRLTADPYRHIVVGASMVVLPIAIWKFTR